MTHLLRAAQVFDGTRLLNDCTVSVTDDGRIGALYGPDAALPEGARVMDLGAGVLAPGFVDLQVNGGGGEMIGPETDAAQLARICATHARLGSTAILPTLITDTPDVTRHVLDAGAAAARAGVAGFAGLHLEGPHLDPARCGAHDPQLIRPMEDADLALLCQAASTLPALLVTLAPEAVSGAQIAALRAAGVRVSLGHTNCSSDVARAAHQAGAGLVTHLFNAMGGLAPRAPGLVGAALTSDLVAGIIADGVHVAPECLQVALAMTAPDRLFLVSDAMAVAGSAAQEFSLGGRRILRRDGSLTLADGTLAGADITLAQAVARLCAMGVDRARALAMASRIPADLIGARDRGRLNAGARADMVLLSEQLELQRVWQGGKPI